MTTDRRWHDAAFDLFGYKIGGSTSHDAIAKALREIDEALSRNQDVTITVVGGCDWQGEPVSGATASDLDEILGLDNRGPESGCTCTTCWPRYPYFWVCSICGNKRCPKASDHALDCSRSNEPAGTVSL